MENKRINSIKRNAILDFLESTKEHPTAEMLYNEVKLQYPTISQATVYRNLGVLLENGEVIKVCNVDGKDRYDSTTYPHPHFICRTCHRVIDVDIPGDYRKSVGTLNSLSGFEVDSVKLEFTGICDKCRRIN